MGKVSFAMHGSSSDIECPSEADLILYCAGDAATALSNKIDKHVADCSTCVNKVIAWAKTRMAKQPPDD